jgi:pimeloyl-ACP methyl ester carboxylesterase
MIHHHADLGDVRLHFVTAGEGFPVVLLHGWPQTWYEWRHIVPVLAQGYRVIAPDLRGLGDSSRPADGYDKKTVGNDIWRLVHDHLGIDAFHLVGHDWGGPTAYAVAAAHPDAVRTLTILDVTIPGDGSPNISQGGRRWHHAFHQTLDLPEALVAGREEIYFGWFYRNYGHHPNVIPEADIAEYLRTYRQIGALRAGFAYYRNIPRDIADNAAIAKDFKLPMPVLALGGNSAWGRRLEVVESLRHLATDVRGGVIEDCGHWMPEEQPEALLGQLTAFFKENGLARQALGSR